MFDVGNNLYRLIGRINYRAGMLFVPKVMDHEEYDRRLWVDQCGCRNAPAEIQGMPKKTSPGSETNLGDPWPLRPHFRSSPILTPSW